MNSKPEISVEPQPDVNQAIGALIDKVSATSIAEFEKLISDLETARNYLKAEGDRIEQEMVRYAHLSDTASASVKIIAERFGQWRERPTDNASLEARRGNSHAL